MFLREALGIRHHEGLALPVKPEGAIASGLVNSIVDLGGGADVVAVGQKGDLWSLESFPAHLKPSLAKGIDLAVVNVGVGDIERDEVDSGVAQKRGVATKNVGVSRVVVAVLRLAPVVEGSFWTELFFGSGHDLGEIKGTGFRMSPEPEEVEDANFSVLLDGAGFLVEREAASEVIGCGPRGLGGKSGDQESDNEAKPDRLFRLG